MALDTSWVTKEPAIKHHPFFEIEDTKPAKNVLDNGELDSSGLSRIIGTSAAL